MHACLTPQLSPSLFHCLRLKIKGTPRNSPHCLGTVSSVWGEINSCVCDGFYEVSVINLTWQATLTLVKIQAQNKVGGEMTEIAA